MTLTKESIVDKIEVVGPHNHIQVRIADCIKEDDTTVAATFSRYVIAPGDDISNEPLIVKNIASVVHTPEVINRYKVSQLPVN